MKILVVSARYGADAGDAAGHARFLAVRMSVSHDVEVATIGAASAANDGDTIDGLRIRRFAASVPPRDGAKSLEELLGGPHTLADERRWYAAQAPHSPDLLEFLHRDGRAYDVVVFHDYRSRPASDGLVIVPERALLIPFVADGAALALAPYRAPFQMARAFGFVSAEERDVVHAGARNAHIPHEIVGPATEDVLEEQQRRIDALVELAVP